MNFSQPPGMAAGYLVMGPSATALGHISNIINTSIYGPVSTFAGATNTFAGQGSSFTNTLNTGVTGMGTSGGSFGAGGTSTSPFGGSGSSSGSGGSSNGSSGGAQGPGGPPPPGCVNVISHWVTTICWTGSGVLIYFKQDHKHKKHTIIGCLYPTTTLDDYNWIIAQPSKGKAVWQRFYWLPYLLVF
jgi:hypothetical protein